LTGRLLYDGEPPVPQKVTVDKDVEVCGKCNLVHETLLVDPNSKGIRNVIVMLTGDLGKSVAVHESYKETETADVVFDNEHCRFEPHVVLLRATQKLVMRARDPIASNVKIDMSPRNPSINITIASGGTYEKQFPRAESMPRKITCPVHTWELAWIVVKDHPYMAATDEQGNFAITNVPAGKQEFMFWQEQAGYLREVTVGGKKEAWQRGRVALTLKPGDNDLGDIVVSEKLFPR